MAMVASWYPLYAALKGELLPAGQSLVFVHPRRRTAAHVSLIETLLWQATRGGGGMFNLDNQFWRLRAQRVAAARCRCCWSGGTVAVAINLLRGLRDRRALAAGLLGVLPLYYLARGGVVLRLLRPRRHPVPVPQPGRPGRRPADAGSARRGAPAAGRRSPARPAGRLPAGGHAPAALHRSVRARRGEAVAWIKRQRPAGESHRHPRRPLDRPARAGPGRTGASPTSTATGRSPPTRRSATASSTTTGARWTTSSCCPASRALLAETNNTVDHRGPAQRQPRPALAGRRRRRSSCGR